MEKVVSVLVLTYNQEDFIAKAIEGILMQETAFGFEILIGEDASSDGTKEIIRGYYEKYPDKIRPFVHKRNVGATKNLYAMLQRAEGKYLAFCEGDDFWHDGGRLQRHIDFLESHKEFSAVCSRCDVVDETGEQMDPSEIPPQMAFWRNTKEIYKFHDFEKWEMPGHLSALTMRNVFLDDRDSYRIVYRAHDTVADRTMVLLAALRGDIYCSDDIVSSYRFRVSESSDNYMSEYKNKNLRAKDYQLMCRLERYAHRADKKLDLTDVKKDRLVASVTIFLRTPSKENAEVIGTIIRASGDSVRSLYHVMKIIILKEFYWNILKTDKRIRL